MLALLGHVQPYGWKQHQFLCVEVTVLENVLGFRRVYREVSDVIDANCEGPLGGNEGCLCLISNSSHLVRSLPALTFRYRKAAVILDPTLVCNHQKNACHVSDRLRKNPVQ